MTEGANKLNAHLQLLREEYVKLQKKLNEVEKRCEVLQGSNVATGDDTFVSKLLKFVHDLYNNSNYSDVKIKMPNEVIPGHRFVFAARSSKWSFEEFNSSFVLDFSAYSPEVARAFVKWIYTDKCDWHADEKNEDFMLNMLRVAHQFQLLPLKSNCEQKLISSLESGNCIKYYQIADDVEAPSLKHHCAGVIANYWELFTFKDFSNLSATTAYQVFKSKSCYPLHVAIRMRREDVVFLFMIEFNSQLPNRLNEMDEVGDLPIDLALISQQEGVLKALIERGVDVNRPDSDGYCLLHKAIKRGDEYSATFLIDNGCNVNLATYQDGKTPLHLVASYNSSSSSQMDGACRIASTLLKHSCHVNAQDVDQRTALHQAIESNNVGVFSLLIEHPSLNFDLQNREGHTPLWLALIAGSQDNDGKVKATQFHDDLMVSNNISHRLCYGDDDDDDDVDSNSDNKSREEDDGFPENSMASQLVAHGCSVNVRDDETGNTMLHEASLYKLQNAGIFLLKHGAHFDSTNLHGETPLHISCRLHLLRLVRCFLGCGADPNIQTMAGLGCLITPSSSLSTSPFLSCFSSSSSSSSSQVVTKQTPLHMSVRCGYLDVVHILLQICGRKHNQVDANCKKKKGKMLNLNLKDSEGQSCLGVALWKKHYNVALRLINYRANVNDVDNNNFTLLHQAIMKKDSESALFLIDQQADISIGTPEGISCLELSIDSNLPEVVDRLCAAGCDVNATSKTDGCCLLWKALNNQLFEVARILVKNRCDVNSWSEGPNKCQQTLLHRAIDENKEDVACILIRSKCDVNSPRRPGANGEGDEEARDGQSPLHLSAAWGLVQVLQCLIEADANINAKDSEGDTPLHVGIRNQHHDTIFLLLSHPLLVLNIRNKKNQTPFSVAMATRNTKAALAIINRDPSAAEQLDAKGRSFLHLAIESKEFESVLFLIDVQVNVNFRVQDASQRTPLHVAAAVGHEMIIRNLILAGAHVNDVTSHKQTALHIAAMHGHSLVASILIDNNINVNALDDGLNNALHIACQYGHLNVVRVLLTQSHISIASMNSKGHNPLHVLGQHNKESASSIFDLFIQCYPQYPVDQVDATGNSVLMLAYFNGNSSLCRAIIRHGAMLGITNKEGLSIFNAPVATKQLLFKILDMLSKEPPWNDGENCLQCDVKFGLTTRKHHCRHCGRLLCSKCSTKEIPIIKYGLPKPVRVCDLCFDVITISSPS